MRKLVHKLWGNWWALLGDALGVAALVVLLIASLHFTAAISPLCYLGYSLEAQCINKE